MIPATFGALLGFLGLVAPGLVYNIVAVRRRPSRKDSAFAEASRIAITSIGFTLPAVLLLWLLQEHTRLPLPNVALWLARGTKYTIANVGKIFFGLTAELVIACGAAAAGAWLVTMRSRSRFRNDTVYGTVFRRYAPKGLSPWVYVQLDNNIEFWGYERAHDDRDEAGARMLVLAGKTLMRRRPGEAERRPIGGNWDVVVIDASRILYMQVIYQDKDGRSYGAVTQVAPRGEMREIRLEPMPAQVPADAHRGT